MVATALFNWYGQAPAKVFNKEIDWDSDSIHITWHTSSYVPNRDTHTYVSDLTNEVAAGSGYSTGGAVLGSTVTAYTAANAWPQTWAGSVAYNVGEIRRPTSGNGLVYRCVVAGTASSSEPTWPTVINAIVVDGSVTWACVGRGIVGLEAANPAWATASFTGRYVVLSDRTPGSASTQPLIGVSDFGSDQTGGGATTTVTFDAAGALILAVP